MERFAPLTAMTRGAEKNLFYVDTDGKGPGVARMMLDTSRYIWMNADRTTIAFRPVLESDPKLTTK